jgi:hypothetical protein
LQFSAGQLVESRKLWAVQYAMGQEFVYGATCPGSSLTATASLKINKLRTRYVGFRGTMTSAGSLSLQWDGTIIKIYTAAQRDFIHIHDAGEAAVGSVDKIAAFIVSGNLISAQVLALESNVFPLCGDAEEKSTS